LKGDLLACFIGITDSLGKLLACSLDFLFDPPHLIHLLLDIPEHALNFLILILDDLVCTLLGRFCLSLLFLTILWMAL
jgi:hypothetical protein